MKHFIMRLGIAQSYARSKGYFPSLSFSTRGFVFWFNKHREMKYRFYTTSEKAWIAMLEAIRSAQSSIYMESFILIDDDLTHNFFETLKQKARQGVEVKIVLDRVGNFWEGSLNLLELRAAGIEVLLFSRWLYRNHRKILIVDEAVAFIGGVNVGGKYAQWFDLHLRITGRLVPKLLASFQRVYHLAGGQQNHLSLKPLRLHKARHVLYRAKIWLIEHWPIKGQSALQDYYQRKCRQAKKSITIVTPYFIPHRWLIKALKNAVSRGVRAEIIIPKKTDVALADAANWLFAYDLNDGIQFLILPEMNHAKVLLIDDQEGLVGSNNADAQSFDFNLEASLVFKRKDMVGDLRKIIDRWRQMALPFEKMEKRWWWYYPILRPLIKFLLLIL